MQTEFFKMDSNEVKKQIPDFYLQGNSYFGVSRNSTPFGIIGIFPVCSSVCNFGYYVYPQMRHLQKRGLFLEMFTFPKTLGYSFCVCYVAAEKLKRILNRMTKYGIYMYAKIQNCCYYFIDYYPENA